jgi:hypothetical protein
MYNREQLDLAEANRVNDYDGLHRYYGRTVGPSMPQRSEAEKQAHEWAARQYGR